MNIPLGLDFSDKSIDQIKSKDSENSSKPKSNIGNYVGSLIAATKQHYNSMINVSGFHISNTYPNAYTFNEVAFENFMRANGFRFFIRSHTPCLADCYDLRFGNRCITIYSCSNNSLVQTTKTSASQEQNTANKQIQQPQASVVMIEGNSNTLRLISFSTSIERNARRT